MSDIVKFDGQQLATVMDRWNEMERVGEMLVESGLFGDRVKNSAAAVAIVLKGMELGIGPMAAINGISFLQGRTIVEGPLLSQLIRQAGGDVAWTPELEDEVMEQKRIICTVELPGQTPQSASFSMDEAQNAGLLSKKTWQQYPADMLRWRSLARAARKAGFGGGIYVHGEVEPAEPRVLSVRDAIADTSTESLDDVIEAEVARSESVSESLPQPQSEDEDRAKRAFFAEAQGELPDAFIHDWACESFGVESRRELNASQWEAMHKQLLGMIAYYDALHTEDERGVCPFDTFRQSLRFWIPREWKLNGRKPNKSSDYKLTGDELSYAAKLLRQTVTDTEKMKQLVQKAPAFEAESRSPNALLAEYERARESVVAEWEARTNTDDSTPIAEALDEWQQGKIQDKPQPLDYVHARNMLKVKSVQAKLFERAKQLAEELSQSTENTDSALPEDGDMEDLF